MEFWKLFVTALMPVLKVLFLTAVGTILALDRFGILKKDARMHLNTMVFFVFIPALALSNLAEAITFKSLVMLWFMPLNILLTFIIGSALGWLLIKITRAPRHLHGLVLGCCSAAGNLGNMPLIIVPAVCKERSRPFGDKDACNRNGLAYASLSMANSKANDVDDSPMNLVSLPETGQENTSTCPVGPLVSAENVSQANDFASGLEIEIARPDGVAKSLQVTKQAKVRKLLKKSAEKINLKALLTPATIGSIIGLIIGAIPQLQKILVGENAPLHVIEDSISMLGDAAIPAMTLLVGANLLNGLKGSSMQFPIIIGIIIVRYLALPAFGVGILKGAIHIGLIHHDPLYKFLLLLQYALPPAVSISTITQLFGAGVGECSVVMLATYVCASASLTLWSTFFMWLVL
ncbi:protein PIN-LIKES 1-like isoform X4 [Prosopis cineraria]|uniref:protein PIN-LIKES 1-like isoform X4 n=1 Tax=Prosopis cineraria TaxID=364024 RepID=UPI00241025CD|nr:protein PIN-LIKES 1-like isoform X4 [Prosopis cineraria]